MPDETRPSEKLRVIVAGGGVAALETILALGELAPDLTDVTVIAPNQQFVYRPMSVREPFAHGPAKQYPLAPIIHDAGARLIADELAWVDPGRQIVHTRDEEQLEYDALVLALGARQHSRYRHATTVDDRRMDEVLHGIVQDVEAGYMRSLAFVSPGRMAWPLPLYELALMTAARAYDMDVGLRVTIVTPEDAPLGIFGEAASNAVAELFRRSGIQTIGSAYAEIPSPGQLVINPGDRSLSVDRVIALPELYGPAVHGLPLGEHGFLRVSAHGEVLDVDHVYAAGDCTEFPIKHGGIGAQQADAVAQSLAARAGAPVAPKPFHPVIRGMLLTGGKPLYMTARITGGHGFSSEITDSPTWDPPNKIAAKYLAPYLDARDHEQVRSR